MVEVEEMTGAFWCLLVVIFAGVGEDSAVLKGDEESGREAAQKDILVELF